MSLGSARRARSTRWTNTKSRSASAANRSQRRPHQRRVAQLKQPAPKRTRSSKTTRSPSLHHERPEMMATETPTKPYVICSGYCGKAIYDSLTDHNTDCGAPLAERTRIETQLRTLQGGSTVLDVEVDSKRAKLRRTPETIA